MLESCTCEPHAAVQSQLDESMMFPSRDWKPGGELYTLIHWVNHADGFRVEVTPLLLLKSTH